MNEDMRVVFESANRRSCSDRALVLTSLQIPYTLVDDAHTCALLVPAEYSAQAAAELRMYDEENPPATPTPVVKVETYDPLPGLVGYVLTVCLVAGMAGFSFFDANWLAAGRVDGELVRQGELWRLITALSLHSGIKHLLGNLVFGVFFGLFAGRMLGSGVGWLAIVVAAAVANGINLLLLEPGHRAIGASTAVFAALGIVAGYVWQGQLMAQGRWSTRYGPIVGGLALLMYTGTGGPNTDVGAHLLGFVCGFGSGMLLTRVTPVLSDRKIQRRSGMAAIALIVVSWIIALTVRF